MTQCGVLVEDILNHAGEGDIGDHFSIKQDASDLEREKMVSALN